MSDEVYVLVLSFLGSFIFFFFLFFKVGRQNIFGYYASAIVLGFFSFMGNLLIFLDDFREYVYLSLFTSFFYSMLMKDSEFIKKIINRK